MSATFDDAIKAINELTAAVSAQTALMKSWKSSTGGAAASAGSTSSTTRKSTEKAVTLDTIKKRFGAYLGVEDEELLAARKTKVAAIVKKFPGAKKISEIDESKYAEAIALLDKAEKDEGDGDGGDDDSLV